MDREGELLQRVSALESSTDVKFERIEKDIGEIKENIRQLTALANKGRGSLSTFLWMGGLIVGLAAIMGSLTGFWAGINK